MTDHPPVSDPVSSPLAPAARRALAEAEARRREAVALPPPERGGPGGPDPARYGDWEVKGRAIDF